MFEQLTIKNLYDLKETIAADLFEGLTYPWEALPKIGEFIMALGIPSRKANMRKKATIYGSQKTPSSIRQQ